MVRLVSSCHRLRPWYWKMWWNLTQSARGIKLGRCALFWPLSFCPCLLAPGWSRNSAVWSMVIKLHSIALYSRTVAMCLIFILQSWLAVSWLVKSFLVFYETLKCSSPIAAFFRYSAMKIHEKTHLSRIIIFTRRRGAPDDSHVSNCLALSQS